MKRLIIVLMCFTLFGCAKRGKDVSVENSLDDYNVQFLFQCENVKVYRFTDCGRKHYFAVGNNGTIISTTQVQRSGKSTHRWEDGAETIYVGK